MTHDLLQTDIELAIRLRGELRPDEEVIRALLQRGVEPGQAAQLVDDLRNGREVSAQSPLPQELRLRHRSRAASKTSDSAAPAPAPSRRAESRHAHPASRPQPTRQGSRLLVQVSAGLAVLGLVVLAYVLYRRSQDNAVSPAEPPSRAGQPGDTAAGPADAPDPATQNEFPAPLLLELRPDGLRIAGQLVARDTVLPALRNLLGVPSRTNQVAQTGATIYAYDRHGLLVYAQPGGGTNSIVLDCEATGGVNGTTSPFAGSLKLQDHVIRPDMDPPALAAIKEFDLRNSGGSGSVWNGRYHSLDLVFAYLKSPGHLSVIEIDLK